MENEISFLDKFLVKFFPKLFLKRAARRRGLNSKLVDCAERLFRNTQRIDFQPLNGEHRGLIIYLDQKLSLWFYQDGDHFVYDGFEIGEYDKGEVTVFDSIREG